MISYFLWACTDSTPKLSDPVDDAEDLNLPHWSGVIPIESVYGAPVSAADLKDSIEPRAELVRGAAP